VPTETIDQILSELNEQQRVAAVHGQGPLLIIAGAGTGKTTTLAHRVACRILAGIDPSRIMLLTFTRRASSEMLRRVDSILHRLGKIENHAGRAKSASRRLMGGTFHSVGTHLLRKHGRMIGLNPDFTILDRSDAEDLLNVVRTELKLADSITRFPLKGTCMDIYSRCVNAQMKIDKVLADAFPWCVQHADGLKQLFKAFVDRKEQQSVLDYDDLLLFWRALVLDENAAAEIRKNYECVMVDEYQDTNKLQADTLLNLCPDGIGLTVVGDDAQSIYSFRAATVRNILDFPNLFPGTEVVTLEQNYRSTQSILDLTNAVISQAAEGHRKKLWAARGTGERPELVTCADEDDQTDFLIDRIMEHRELGTPLKQQAILFRASHHSLSLEVELGRYDIPYHKYGGLKFIETAHVKDLLSFLRLAENPLDMIAGMRVLILLPGIGRKKAADLMDRLREAGGHFDAWQTWKPPAGAVEYWPELIGLMTRLVNKKGSIASDIHSIRDFYTPLLEMKHDHVDARLQDLQQLEAVADRSTDRAEFLQDMALDPPSSTQELAGDPTLDEDYLILSTIHSAKGLEWDAVYVIHAADGNIPSDLATGSAEEIEEERRLFYVAMTRAKSWLTVTCPLRYYHRPGAHRDAHGYAQISRFLSKDVRACFDDRGSIHQAQPDHEQPHQGEASDAGRIIRRRTKDLWNE
jgi:DNA helicase-2/ATP-dependent DNA helicase PcrA